MRSRAGAGWRYAQEDIRSVRRGCDAGPARAFPAVVPESTLPAFSADTSTLSPSIAGKCMVSPSAKVEGKSAPPSEVVGNISRRKAVDADDIVGEPIGFEAFLALGARPVDKLAALCHLADTGYVASRRRSRPHRRSGQKSGGCRKIREKRQKRVPFRMIRPDELGAAGKGATSSPRR